MVQPYSLVPEQKEPLVPEQKLSVCYYIYFNPACLFIITTTTTNQLITNKLVSCCTSLVNHCELKQEDITKEQNCSAAVHAHIIARQQITELVQSIISVLWGTNSFYKAYNGHQCQTYFEIITTSVKFCETIVDKLPLHIPTVIVRGLQRRKIITPCPRHRRRPVPQRWIIRYCNWSRYSKRANGSNSAQPA